MSKSGENTRALVRFPSPTVPSGCVLQSATLRLYAGGAASGRTLQALPLGRELDGGRRQLEQPARHDRYGRHDRLRHGLSRVERHDAGGGDGRELNYGFLIRDAVENNGGSEQQFNSREKSDNQPQMVYRFAARRGRARELRLARRRSAPTRTPGSTRPRRPPTRARDPTLKIVSKGPAHNTRGLVRFNLPALPAGCAVESATLRLHLNALATDRVLEAWQVGGSWSEGGVTWDNQPATVGEPVDDDVRPRRRRDGRLARVERLGAGGRDVRGREQRLPDQGRRRQQRRLGAAVRQPRELR